MENLGCYGSDNDSEEDKSMNHTENRSCKKDDVEIKSNTKKKLNVSILPQHIQDALARGVQDSDSDDDQKSLKLKTSARGFSAGNGLLGMLPQPIHRQENASQLSGSRFSGSSPNNNVKDPVVPVFQSDVTVVVPDDEECDETIIPQPFRAPTIAKLPTWSDLTSSTNGNVSTLSSSFTSQGHLRPTVNAAPRYDLPQQDISDTIGPSFQPNYQDNNHHMTFDNNFPDMELDKECSAITSKRRREKNIEHQLLRGDIGVVSSLGIKDIKQSNEAWNSELYNAQASKEQELMVAFGMNTARGEKLIVQPNSVQNKRHQINSLACHAVQTEMKLLELQGQRLKSKGETMAKYGW